MRHTFCPQHAQNVREGVASRPWESCPFLQVKILLYEFSVSPLGVCVWRGAGSVPTSRDLCLWAAFGFSGSHDDQPPGPTPTCLPRHQCHLLSALGSFTGLSLRRSLVACPLHLVDQLDPQLPSVCSLTSPSAGCDLVMILYFFW